MRGSFYVVRYHNQSKNHGRTVNKTDNRSFFEMFSSPCDDVNDDLSESPRFVLGKYSFVLISIGNPVLF